MNEVSTRRRMGLVVALIALVAIIVALVAALPTDNADATVIDEDCSVFYNHSGHIPGSYDYAEFYEDGQLVTTAQTNGVDIFVDPAQYDAGSSWDQVNKCHNGDDETTTTTIIEETTTTVVEETTTTAPEETTTTQPEETTIPLPTFTPGIACVDTNVVITAVFNPAEFSSVDVYHGIPDDSIEGVLNSSDDVFVWGPEEEGVIFTLVGNGDGFVQSQTVSTPPDCDESPVITVPPTTTPPELPFTGVNRGQLIALGFSALLFGLILVTATKREVDDA